MTFISKHTSDKSNVICIHIGARAHYLIPKALQATGNLKMLITDSWVGAAWLRVIMVHIPVRMFRSLAARYTIDVPSAKVRSFGLKFLIYECILRLRYSYSWPLIQARDRSFEALALKKMEGISQSDIVFGISYTSLACFTLAKSKGIKTILFQVDPGPEEERIVSSLLSQYKYHTSWQPAPMEYWQRWKQECALADTVMVNSEWSKSGLMQEGIPEQKIRVVPLPFELNEKHESFIKSYPAVFTEDRPLRCLFLGTLALRKGIHLVLEAAKALQEYPVEFILVGRSELQEDELQETNIFFKGLVTREETDVYYQQADVLLFPTLSDGFGLTQLEAMAWQLPVIATDRCGDVVMENHNGWRIDPSDASELIQLLKHIVVQPAGLKQRSGHCLDTVGEYNTVRFAAEIEELL